MIELLSSDDENDDEDESKDTDESIGTFYQKFSSQLQLNDSTTNHLLNQKYIEIFSINSNEREREK